MGKIHILDAVHTESYINKNKENSKNNALKEKGETPKPPKDPDATWGTKGKRKIIDPITKEERVINKSFYGYKTHVSLDQKTGLATSLDVSTGSSNDGIFAIPLIQNDINKGLKPTAVTADKAYDDGEFHYFLEQRNIFDVVSLKKTRTSHKNKRLNEKWEKQKSSPLY